MADAITAYLAGEAAGAIPNGSKVIKQNSEEGDAHPDEVKGVVVSSLGRIDARLETQLAAFRKALLEA